MFSSNSRYYKLKNVAKQDSLGRINSSKELRLIPKTRGNYQHIIEDTDRLDNLAFKYYKKPGHWWRICDANPGYLSPRALIGKEPLRVTRFDLEWDGIQAPWHQLMMRLQDEVGVLKVLPGTESQPYPEVELYDNGFLFSLDTGLLAEITTSILVQQITPALQAGFSAAGYLPGTPIYFSQPGENHWILVEQSTDSILSIRLQEGVLNVFQGARHLSWSITVYYNDNNITSEILLAKIESDYGLDFVAGSPADIGRMGKPIIVPPITVSSGQ